MRLRSATHSPHLFDRQRHPAPMLTVHKAARQVNYFQTGNVPQRCTKANIRAPCFDSAQVQGSIRGMKAGNNDAAHEAMNQGSGELNPANSATMNKPRPRKKKRGTATPETARMVPRHDLPQEKNFSASCAWPPSWPCLSFSPLFSWASIFSWPRPSSSARSFSPHSSWQASPWE